MKPLTSFGIHQATFKDKADNTWTAAKILGSLEVDLKQEAIDLEGGSSIVAWGSAPGRASGEMTLTIKDYKKELLKFLAPYKEGSITETATGNAAGALSAIVNLVGASLVDATNGVASISVGTATDLSAGKYKVVCTGAATLDIYSDNDVEGKVSYQDSTLKINTASLTIPSSSTVEFQGIVFAGGAGIIGMTTGDIATFEVTPINNYVLEYEFGKAGACQREFELCAFSECESGKLIQTIYPRCVAFASILPNHLENDWSSIEATIKVLQPTEAGIDYVAKSKFINR